MIYYKLCCWKMAKRFIFWKRPQIWRKKTILNKYSTKNKNMYFSISTLFCTSSRNKCLDEMHVKVLVFSHVLVFILSIEMHFPELKWPSHMTPHQIFFIFFTFFGNTLQSRGKAGVTGAFSTYSCFSAFACLVVIHHLLPLCSLSGPRVTCMVCRPGVCHEFY